MVLTCPTWPEASCNFKNRYVVTLRGWGNPPPLYPSPPYTFFLFPSPTTFNQQSSFVVLFSYFGPVLFGCTSLMAAVRTHTHRKMYTRTHTQSEESTRVHTHRKKYLTNPSPQSLANSPRFLCMYVCTRVYVRASVRLFVCVCEHF